ncbi:alpha/beta hydrolase [Pseudaestuariivita rosea]|uniref:alpha/beta hydrolase n=1 Tax=Pseudaestuariivita rosea TaxID=2763263 RepID=UPI001ABA344E|nr:alpha/beta fold hydrolase [Pseudaestuariivita rosea]
MEFPETTEQVDKYLSATEANVPNLRDGVEKRVIWARPDKSKTDIAVVYIHGFSATSEEIRPVPDLVAQALGANLHYTRLAGHGQDGAAMGQAGFGDWMDDARQAIAIGNVIGEKVLILSCSTGGTLVPMLLSDNPTDRAVLGAVFVAPNFGLSRRMLRVLLSLPGIERWGHLLVGREQGYDVMSDQHQAYWTTRFPTRAVFTMRQAVRTAWRVNAHRIKTPALVIADDRDKVVSTRDARRYFGRWGGPVTFIDWETGPDDDPNHHLIMGDIFSPSQTQPATQAILDWFHKL